MPTLIIIIPMGLYISSSANKNAKEPTAGEEEMDEEAKESVAGERKTPTKKFEVYDDNQDGSYTHPQFFFDEPITAADLAEEKIDDIMIMLKQRRREFARIESDRRKCAETVQALFQAGQRNAGRERCIELVSHIKLLQTTEVAIRILTQAMNKLRESITMNKAAEEFALAATFLNSMNRGMTVDELRVYKQYYEVNSAALDEKTDALQEENETAERMTDRVYRQQLLLAGIDIEKEINAG